MLGAGGRDGRDVRVDCGRGAGAELAPLELEPLPIGAVRTEGWLKHQLGLMTEGLVGRLYETSEFLSPTNGWLRADGVGWEEQPYWFRSFVKLAALTGDERCLRVSREWVERILAIQDADGWFGPRELKEHRFANGAVVTDIWGHMVMSDALMSWWELRGDRRVVDLLVRFYRFVAVLPEAHLLAERLRFVPLGCQRCRLSVLPQATDDPEVGVRWKTPPAKTLRKNR